MTIFAKQFFTKTIQIHALLNLPWHQSLPCILLFHWGSPCIHTHSWDSVPWSWFTPPAMPEGGRDGFHGSWGPDGGGRTATSENHYLPSPDDVTILHSNNNNDNVFLGDPCHHHQGGCQPTVQQWGPLTFYFAPNDDDTEFKAKNPQAELLHWHCLGHCSFTLLKQLAQSGEVPKPLATIITPKCTGCLFGAMTMKKWYTEGSSDKQIQEAMRTNKCVSMDQMMSTKLTSLPRSKSGSCNSNFKQHWFLWITSQCSVMSTSIK